MRDHTNEFGNFLDTMYDTALQYPLFELAGPKHTAYINEVSYLYFSAYGDNDDSNILKSLRRIFLHIFVSWRSPLSELTHLGPE